jgi:septum formation protein
MAECATSDTRLILASGSPRRRELLARITSTFEVVPPEVDEPTEGSPEERVLLSSVAKARWIGARRAGVIIAADTLVVVDAATLGKPSSDADAAQMLRTLSGREHTVVTGVCVRSTESGKEATGVETTIVRFRMLGDDEIDAYVRSGEPKDKAGGYAIQGRGALFVEGVRGDFYNVMGLPLCRLGLLLREVGVRV